jgi:hypothetical protein
MSSSTVPKNVEILTTLEEDPHVSFFNWEIDVHDVAAGMAKSIHPMGLLSDILTDEQWAAYPGNSAPDQNNQMVVAARYRPPVFIDINDQMSSVELYVAKASNDRLQLWIDSGESLKRAVIKSLGRSVCQIVRDIKVRFQRLSVGDIINRVRGRYGQMQKDTNTNLKERMLTLLPSTDLLDTHISNMREMFDISDTAGFPIDEYRQVEIFREITCTHALIEKVLGAFDLEFPHSKGHTFAQISDYVVTHLPNLKHAQMISSRASANMVATKAYATLEVESKRLRNEHDQLKKKRPPRSNKKQKSQKQKATGHGKHTTGDTATLKYCHAHGFQPSHTSSECKVLAGDKKKYTPAMRRAQGPKDPPGGSTKVNKQVVSASPRTVTANMAYKQEYMSDSDDDDETTAFLAQIMKDTADDNSEELPDAASGYLPPDYATTQASAMMMNE